MTKPKCLHEWFENCGGWAPRHDLDELRQGIEAGMLNEQDEYGMTALSLAVMSGWEEGVAELLRAGATPSCDTSGPARRRYIWRCKRGRTRSSQPW